jgi:hypothetical protein
MHPPAGQTFPKFRAAACLVVLAVVSLALSGDPPADPVLPLLNELLRKALRIPIQTAFLLGMLGGLAILAALVAMVIGQYLQGARVDWWSLLSRRLWQTALGYCLVGLIYLVLHLLKPVPPTGVSPGQTSSQPSKPQGTALPAPSVPRAGTSTSMAPVFVAGAALLAGIGGLLFALRGQGRRDVPMLLSEESGRLAEARRRLELGDQVRDAIVGCYAEMCGVFSGRRPPGIQSLTAREFAVLLRSRGVGEPEILTLTSLFEKARYSIDPCDERDRSQAIAALRAIESHYGPPGPAPLAGGPA